jgi:hypothetical protein
LTGDREYSIASRATTDLGSDNSSNPGASKSGLHGLANKNAAAAVSGFEAIYGHAAKVDKNNKMEESGNSGAVNVSQWGALFDAPSHALPPMGTLCPAFLELMITGGGGGEMK